jgi:NADH:quinone reductase (non-electrogenic)
VTNNINDRGDEKEQLDNKTVVILGAGYAGLFLSLNLESYVGSLKDCKIILIDKNPFHQLLQEIHLVAAGARTEQEVKISIPAMLAGKNIQFIQGTIKQIRIEDRMVVYDDVDGISEFIGYDYLVVALGASTRYFDIPGAEQFSLPLRSISDAASINVKVRQLMLEDSVESNPESTYKKIVIVGGGATGVSLAGALSDYVNASPSAGKVSVEIIEATPTILPGWDKNMVRECMKVLWEKSVKVFTSVPVARVEQDWLYLKDGTAIPSSMTIWTAGVKGYNVKTQPEIEKLRDGRIVVNEFCQSDQYRDIFVVGDIAALKDHAGKLYPPLAQVAVRQAKYLAELLAQCIIKGKMPDEKFDYSIKAQIISLGINDYVGSFGDHVISGNVARLVEEFSKDAYARALKSGGEALAANLYRNDAISQVLAGITFAGFTFNRILHKL